MGLERARHREDGHARQGGANVVLRAVDDLLPAPGTQLPAYLSQVGGRLLDGVIGKPHAGRELALDLLAADAFATYAFEAQAEEGSLHET